MLEDLKPHLIDLRKRLVTSAFALIMAFAICFSFNEAILGWMLEPLIKVLPTGSKPVFLQVGEAFLTAIKVSIFCRNHSCFAHHLLANLAFYRPRALFK